MTTETKPAVDADLLLDAAGLLSELAHDPQDGRSAVSELQGRHAEHRLHLIIDEEAYDGSVHRALLVRQADGLTLSLSAATEPGLPWPLRGVVRAREFDLLAVNGMRVPVAEALACIDGMFDDRKLMRTLVDSCLIRQALEEQPVDVSPALLQQTADAFRRGKNLNSAEATRAWLADRSLSQERFAELIADLARTRALRQRVVGGEVDDWFVANQQGLAVITAAWVAGADQAIAEQLEADPLGALVQARRDGRDGGVSEWRVGELSDGLRALAAAVPGAATRIDLDSPAVAVVLDHREPVLDDATRDGVERRLFDRWLAERRRTAHVQWFWGNEARTDRAAEG